VVERFASPDREPRTAHRTVARPSQFRAAACAHAAADEFVFLVANDQLRVHGISH
jgi:hypothetical protein